MKVYTYPQLYQQIVDNFYFPDLCRSVYLYIVGYPSVPRRVYYMVLYADGATSCNTYA